MKANKDRGTSEMPNEQFDHVENQMKKLNKVCKEHEWHLIAFRPTNNSDFIHESRCKNCGILRSKEAHKVINKLEWEDIEKEFEIEFTRRFNTLPMSYINWLKEKFLAPEKKNT